MGAVQRILILIVNLMVLLCVTQSHPVPDSAGIVEMPPGAAYGGIPYGSVTGMVADYYNGGRSQLPRGQQPLHPVYY